MPEANTSDHQLHVLAKLIIFCAIPLLAILVIHATYVELGLSLLVASLLQALIPPRRTGLAVMLVISGAVILLAVVLQWRYRIG